MLRFARKLETCNFICYIHNVHSFRDLGVIMDRHLDFNMGIDEIATKANRMLGFIKRRTADFDDLGCYALYIAS